MGPWGPACQEAIVAVLARPCLDGLALHIEAVAVLGLRIGADPEVCGELHAWQSNTLTSIDVTVQVREIPVFRDG